MRPWEWALLAVDEADHLLDWLDQYEKDINEANAKMK